MKKFLLVVLSVIFLILPLGGCGKSKDTYGEKEMITPFWVQSKMYNESVMMVLTEGETLANGNLAFEPTGKIKITNSTMDVVYEEGKDYTVSGRTITVTENTSMPWINEGVLYGIDMPSGEGLSTQPASAAGKAKGYDTVLYTESVYLIKNQVLVTYSYDKSDFDQSVIPVYQGDKLTNTLSILQGKGCLNIISYGDSISTGCNSTGGELISVYDGQGDYYIPFDRAPYTPTYPEMFATGLVNHYRAETTLFGAGRGGQTSDWAAKNAADRVVNPDYGYEPDLVIVSLGMNDATLGLTLSDFKNNLLGIIDNIRAKSEKTVEFIFMGTMLANPDAVQCNNQEAYYPIMQEVAAEREVL